MRGKRGVIKILVVLFMVCMVQSVSIKAADCMPMYVSTSTCSVMLTFNSNTAKCSAIVTGRDGTTSISGTLKLYDVTESKTVKKWSVSKLGAFCSASKTATVKSGHTYRLKFTGKVLDRNGNSESITKKVKKTN